LIGSVMIGWPSEIPANRLKFDGVPADSTVAVTAPPRTWAGSAMTAPPAGATTEKTPVLLSTRPVGGDLTGLSAGVHARMHPCGCMNHLPIS
jgi:hypothetical protein